MAFTLPETEKIISEKKIFIFAQNSTLRQNILHVTAVKMFHKEIVYFLHT
jgi:hypothetical protein